MTKTHIQKIRELSSEERETRIIELEKELIDLRIKKTTRQNIKPHQIKQTKHALAQLLTIQNELN